MNGEDSGGFIDADIQHVFVLMFENRSFDHMFALSGIPDILAAKPNDSQYESIYNGQCFPFIPGAPDAMPTDPLHSFCDVAEQLGGQGTPCPNHQPYPKTDNQGFVANYARSRYRKQPPTPAQLPLIMAGLDVGTQAPAFLDLAEAFVLCDHWRSSLPGPTWPNRFFLHGASSSGLDDAPTGWDMAKWLTFSGFRYPNGSIYDALGDGRWRVYHDQVGSLFGRIPQVASLHGVSYFDCHGFDHFEDDLNSGFYSAAFTLIEPSYGDIVTDTYEGGTSQHPMDGLAGGNNLLARVYAAIRNSPVWENSLLVVTYDEHGGFYDSVAPIKLPPPGDDPDYGYNTHGFDFSLSGVRVPALLASPWLPKAEVDHTPYDHTSVIATLNALFGTGTLTDRGAAASAVLGLAIDTPREDCPETLTTVPEPVFLAEAALSPEQALEPISESGNLPGFLAVVRKAELEMRAMRGELVEPEDAPLPPDMTRAQAREYLRETLPMLREVRRNLRLGPA